jgi:hypothetical protein
VQAIHLRFICRNENIRRSAFFDLSRQHTRRSEVQYDFGAGLFLEASVDLLQGISQAGGSGDKQLIRISRCDQSGENEPK